MVYMENEIKKLVFPHCSDGCIYFKENELLNPISCHENCYKIQEDYENLKEIGKRYIEGKFIHYNNHQLNCILKTMRDVEFTREKKIILNERKGIELDLLLSVLYDVKNGDKVYFIPTGFSYLTELMKFSVNKDLEFPTVKMNKKSAINIYGQSIKNKKYIKKKFNLCKKIKKMSQQKSNSRYLPKVDSDKIKKEIEKAAEIISERADKHK